MKLSSVVALILVGTLSSAGAQTVQLPRTVQFQVACLDCTFGLPLMPTGINSAGLVVANSPDLRRGFIIDYGQISVVPTFDGGWLNSANGINDSGLVVGTSNGGVWNGHAGTFAYTWDGTTLTNLGDSINVYRDGFWSQAFAVNAAGQVAGQATSDFQTQSGFIYSAGVMTGIAFPDAFLTYATGINSHGRVVGTAEGDIFQAWTYKGGKLTNLNGNYARSDAFAVNDHDQIAGDVRIDDGNGHVTGHAVVWDNSTTPTILPSPPGRDFFPYGNGINNHGWVVGQACSAPFVDCVAVLSDVTTTINLNKHLDPFDKINWVLMNAVGINDAGQIIGTGTLYGEPQAFLATPVK